MMSHLVRTVSACNLRLGDIVIPDRGPRQRVTMHRIEGSHPVIAVQFADIPGVTTYYPPNMLLFIEEPDQQTGRMRSAS